MMRVQNWILLRVALGVCLINPSLQRERKAGRCKAAGSKKPEAYSLEYVEGARCDE
jgi:hypothetical protein